MMSVDTNVLVYLHDDGEPEKQATAAIVVGAVMDREGVVGLQCVGEFQNILRRKLRAPAWAAAEEARNLLVSFGNFPSSASAALEALAAVATGRGSYWDTLLIHSAAEAGCSVIFSEDSQGANRVAGVEIVNPFDGAGDLSPRARQIIEAQ